MARTCFLCCCPALPIIDDIGCWCDKTIPVGEKNRSLSSYKALRLVGFLPNVIRRSTSPSDSSVFGYLAMPLESIPVYSAVSQDFAFHKSFIADGENADVQTGKSGTTYLINMLLCKLGETVIVMRS